MEVRTVVVPMPTTIKAYTVYYEDCYTIVLNDNISYEQKRKSYLHEMEHIENNDFDKKCSADLIEFMAHM